MLHFYSEAKPSPFGPEGNKPETVVTGECEGIRELLPTETVHYRDNESDTHCHECGKPAKVWFSSKDKWERHTQRCK